MRTGGLVTFLSDFGWSGGYVAACEATMLRISRDLRLAHIAHDVAAGDVAEGALLLARVTPLYPEAVHLAVVDPGVGTSRRPLALTTTRGDVLVGPDNGLLIAAADALGGVGLAWVLDPPAVRSRAGLPAEGVSNTFHGRDVFSPASALLAVGTDPETLGHRVDAALLCRLPATPATVTAEGATAPVVEVDRFGNVALGLDFAALPGKRGFGAAYSVRVIGDRHAQPACDGATDGNADAGRDGCGVGGGATERTAKIARTFGDLAVGELGLICDSWGKVALTLYGASAAESLGLKPGVMVSLTPAKEDADGC